MKDSSIDANNAAAHGPHGGTWVALEDGFVEISVFETKVPPHFRLYFFDADKQSVSPMSEVVTIETIRPDDSSQTFEFQREGDFLNQHPTFPSRTSSR